MTLELEDTLKGRNQQAGMEWKVAPGACPQLSRLWAGSLVKESTFHPVSAARDEGGEVGGFQHIPR